MSVKQFHPNISLHKFSILFSTHFLVLIGRICFTIKNFFSWWSFPLFSWPYCGIQGWSIRRAKYIIVHIQVHCIPCQAGCKLVWHAHCKIEAELILKACNIFYFCQYTPTQNSWVECQGICLLSYIPRIVKKKKKGIHKISKTFH